MHPILFGYTVAFLVLAATPSPVVEYDKGLRYEEYDVEHEISAMQARNAVKHTDYSSVNTPPGCQTCTAEEKRYCLGNDLINDHCCCDKRYHEFFPFIPHTCYLGSTLCNTVALNCGEYNRLRTCCCDKITLEKWKQKSGGSTSWRNSWRKFTLAVCLYIITAVHYYNNT
ncbi:uncharacterized protein LOC109607723 [Aethina tumida]|uniref:uncharacterized protein LOC109607723 n=1 Tax=Aethina tumida TaxID=116153 RepID=UPI00096AE9C3|nr:uncharacterized protein LOC109607723 [Aethina tumida]